MSTMDKVLAAVANGETLSTAEAAARLSQTTGRAGAGHPAQSQSRTEVPVSLG